MNDEKQVLPQGLLIVLEGIDGSGKTSLAEFLADYFGKLGFEVVSTRQPGATDLGKQIRAVLHDRPFEVCAKAEFLLFAADRAQHIESVVKPALAAGSLVISDRMADSSLAYQGAGRGLSTTSLREINEWAMDGIQPDITLYIRVDPQVAFQRMQKRNEALTHFEKEKVDFFRKVSQRYDELYEGRDDVIMIDGNQSIENVQQQVLQALESLQDQDGCCPGCS